MTAAFTPTYVVPTGGLRAWNEPDRSGPVAAVIDAGLGVQLLERRGDSARVLCSNGWQAWVDARELTGAAGTAAPASRMRTIGLSVRGATAISLMGAVGVVAGSLLQWWSIGGVRLTAWDISAKYLATGDASTGLKAAPLLMVVAVLAVPLALGRALPRAVSLAVAFVVLVIAGGAAIRGLRASPSVDPRVGLFLTIGGGILIVLDGAGVGRAETAR